MPDWLVYLLFLPAPYFVYQAARLAPEWWREGIPVWDYDHPAQWWGFGLALWRGVIRMMLAGFVTVVPFLVVGLVWIAFPEGSTVYRVLGWVGALGFFVLLWVEGGIVLFNRPRFLVPLPYRDKPGALAEWRKARAGGRDAPREPRRSARAGRGWQVSNSLWVLWTLGLGYTSWIAFAWIGLRAREPRWIAWAALYLVAAIALVVLNLTPVQDTQIARDSAGLIAIAVLAVSIPHALVARPGYLARRNERGIDGVVGRGSPNRRGGA